jgi:hypothetical protein
MIQISILSKISAVKLPRFTNPTTYPIILQNPIGFLVTDLHWIPSVKFQSLAANFMNGVFSYIVLWPYGHLSDPSESVCWKL